MRSKPEELYNTTVARSFGYIEAIIDRAFNENVPADIVVGEIQVVLDKITKELSRDK